MLRTIDPRRARLLICVVVGTCGFCADTDPLPGPPTPPPEVDEPLLAAHIRDATEAVRRAPRSGAAWGRLGEVYDVNAFEEQALQAYARARELDPDEWRWWYFSGLLLRPSDPLAAVEQLTRAEAIEPDHAALQFHLGFAHYLAENFDEAEGHYRAVLDFDPRCVNARLGLARVAVARGEPRTALDLLLEAANVADEEGAVHLHLAQVYRELGRHPDAEREERRTAASPRRALSDGWAALDDPVREEARAREGVGSRRLVTEARRYMLEGRQPEAVEAFERALQADPDSVPALVVSARLLAQRGELDAARARLAHAVEIDRDDAGILAELATACVLSGRIQEAIQALERAIEIDPALPDLRTRLAGLYVRSGRLREALGLLEEASRLSPEDREVRERMATVKRLLAESATDGRGTDQPDGR